MLSRVASRLVARPVVAHASSGAAAAVLSKLKIGKLNHVAIAVPDMEKASSLYRDVLGAEVSKPAPQPEHGVYTIFVTMPGLAKIELIHPLGESSPIANFLKKNPSGGIHHICVDVPDIRAAIETLNAKGIKTLGTEPKIGAHGNPVIFLHPKSCDGVLLELEEVKPAA